MWPYKILRLGPNTRDSNKNICSLGSGAVDYIVDHAEIDFVFVQDTKIKGVRLFEIILIIVKYTFKNIDLFEYIDLFE